MYGMISKQRMIIPKSYCSLNS